ncbi:condensin complex subunit 2 [Nematocida minor]|uniref:condensin complex subunit 2 n=1 Tax=Nematocida minor TaxID=1912983 RepID=UPI00221F367F|nr:condensin complex subunit 2 [Nematocida minor]KAI5188965.1 condensin complex subunit 2 [Nematocida minor]
MAAAEREIADLLKESTESKINAKTTWHSTLIDDFSNIEKFKEKETNSMNFQHASIVLDGCVKVYSTRVDSVVDEADKLMDSVGRVKEPEKQRVRAKAHPTIESNLEAILIKQKLVSSDDEILEHLARESKEGDTRGLLMHLLKWSDAKGFHVLQTNSVASEDSQCSKAVCSEKEIDFDALHKSFYTEDARKNISPMFSKFTPDKSVEELVLPTYAYNISYDAEPLEYAYKGSSVVFSEPGLYNDPLESYRDDESAEMEGPSKNAENRYEPSLKPSTEELHLVYTPFGYAKGWAGPSHWKVHARKRQRERPEAKERKKAVIDFLTDTHLPIATLFERGEGIVITPQQISERRKNCNTLPPDHNVRIEDLYQMFMYPGFLHTVEEARDSTGSQSQEAPLSPTAFQGADHAQQETDIYEFNGEADYQEAPADNAGSAPEEGAAPQTTLLSRRLLQSALRKARRNDIVKVKESLWSKIEEGEKKVETIYNSIEEQKVSVHFYLVSLLHLANERNLRITSTSKEQISGMADLSLEGSAAGVQ